MKARRANRCSEGAAFVEALIVTVMITVLFAGVWFFHDLHDRKGDTLRLARYQAWAATRPGCDGQVEGRDSQVVKAPHTMRAGSSGTPTWTVSSATAMTCNAVPHPQDDALSAFESIGDIISF